MPAVAPSRTDRGIGTRCPWRRSIAARWVVCQSLQPHAVIDAPRWGSGQESVGAGQDQRTQDALALDALVWPEHVLAPNYGAVGVELRPRAVRHPRMRQRRDRPRDGVRRRLLPRVADGVSDQIVGGLPVGV